MVSVVISDVISSMPIEILSKILYFSENKEVCYVSKYFMKCVYAERNDFSVNSDYFNKSCGIKLMKELKRLELHVTQKDHWSVISRVLSVGRYSCLKSVTFKQLGLDLENFYNLVEHRLYLS